MSEQESERKIFRASSYHSNCPSEFEIGKGMIWWRHKKWFSSDEICIRTSKVRGVEVKGGMIWSTIIITWIGGKPLISHGHPNGQIVAFQEALATARNY